MYGVTERVCTRRAGPQRARYSVNTKAVPGSVSPRSVSHTARSNINLALTFNLPTTTIVAQPFNIIKWQLKFNPVA